VADIRATNPNLWNSWKDALLRELYLQTRWLFRRGLAKPWQQAEKIADVKAEGRTLLKRLGVADPTIDGVWNSLLNDEYFLRYHAEEAAWHTIALSAAPPEQLPLILLRPVSQRGSAEIFIHARHQDFLFAHTTAVLDQLNLTVFDARIISGSEDHVLHSYHVLEQTGAPVRDPMRQAQICVKLKECLTGATQAPFRVQRREPRELRHFNVPTQVYFHEDPQQRHTILELIATDRPGLLSKVGRAFSLCGLRLVNARISTIGSRAEDIFYLTGQDNQPVTDPALMQELKETIIGLVGAT
jgi:[protein-PII] uridylyltransferase